MNRVIHKNPNFFKNLARGYEKLTVNKDDVVAVGFPKGKGLGVPYYPNGTSVIQVAIFNNYGTHEIPSRPFMDLASIDIQKWFRSVVVNDVRIIMTGQKTKERVFNKWGSVAKGLIQEKIGTTGPENAPSTLRFKGEGAVPLIDTGHMRQSVTFVIRKRVS
jgi:hypothetical protein